MVVILIAFTCVVMTGCPNPLVFEYFPSEQPGTTWRTEDNRIVFTIPECEELPNPTRITEEVNGRISSYLIDTAPKPTGTLETNGRRNEIVFYMFYDGPGVILYDLEDYRSSYGHYSTPLEEWTVEFYSSDKFVVRVSEHCYSFFEPGQKLVFYKD